MSELEAFSDMTGTMSDTEVNGQNISNIIDEFNRSQDLLDSLNQTPKIISKGSLEIDWDGTAPFQQNATADIGSSVDFTFLCFYSRSDLPNNLYPIYDLNVNPTTGAANYEMVAQSVGQTIDITFVGITAGSPITFTIYYFIIQQPANVTSS